VFEDALMIYGIKSFYNSGIYADEHFFDVFTFPLKQGDAKTALNEPFSLVITEEMAEKFFGQDHLLFRLHPKAQELFQAVRWRDKQVVALNTEQISKICGFVWPPKDLKDRIRRIRKILNILKENRFINYNQETCENGERREKKSWVFYIAKRKVRTLRDFKIFLEQSLLLPQRCRNSGLQ